jgi:hypothetical protein
MPPRLSPLTIAEAICRMPAPVDLPRLPAPPYFSYGGGSLRTSRICLAVESFRRHMTDEGWQIQCGLREAGYELFGHELGDGLTNVETILGITSPSTVIIQDPREWDASTDNCFVKAAQFHNAECLGNWKSTFKAVIFKDCHRDNEYYREKAKAYGVHAWILYYHPAIVAHCSPWVRPEHCIRMYHSVDGGIVPAFSSEGRRGTIISGAVGNKVYPLRTRLAAAVKHHKLDATLMHHPGYHARGSNTPSFLKTLANFKVSICTASVFGFALRKIIESTACGCRVVTDLPVDEVLPWIDGNLIRVNPTETTENIAEICREAEAGWDAGVQEDLAKLAIGYYDYRAVGWRLANDVEEMRVSYNGSH